MIELIKYSFLFIIAYLLGSIPTAVWIGKAFYDTDVREHGSKNAGATNTIRILGLKAGIPVLLIDALKGWLAVNLSFIIKNDQIIYLKLLLGFFAILGHIFPLFANFKGGKGVATLLGVFLAIIPLATLLSVCTFIIVFSITRYVSVSSISAGILFPIFIYLLKYQNSTLQIIGIVVSILLIITHRKNIRRLIKREENKFIFKKTNH